MKIYFSGAQSSGKSTLARYVSEKYKLPMISEIARMVLSERELNINTLRADIDLVNSYQTEVFYRQITEEAKYDGKDCVSDRCLLDCLAYAIQHSSITQNLINDEKYNNYINALKNSNYIIFFVRPSRHIMKQDGVRESLSFEGMVSIDAIIKTLFEINNIQYFQIDAESAQERINLIDNIIKLHI